MGRRRKVRTICQLQHRAIRKTGPSFCTTANERVYITASGCELEFAGTRGLWAAGAGGL